jgi:hypothetical protein
MSEPSLLDQLIIAFEARARLIARTLSSRYTYVSCEKYVTHFVMLHTDHIHCLRNGDFTTAYNLLRSIGRLSQRLEEEEAKLRQRAECPNKRLKLREERFRRGPLVCGYVAGDFRSFSPKFDTTLSKIVADEPSILQVGVWSWSRGQRDAAEVYNKLGTILAAMSEETDALLDSA